MYERQCLVCWSLMRVKFISIFFFSRLSLSVFMSTTRHFISVSLPFHKLFALRYTAVMIWWKKNRRCASSGQWLRGQPSICHSLVVLRLLKHGHIYVPFFCLWLDDVWNEEWRIYRKEKTKHCAPLIKSRRRSSKFRPPTMPLIAIAVITVVKSYLSSIIFVPIKSHRN